MKYLLFLPISDRGNFPSPLMGEGAGGGEWLDVFPLPSIPSHQGREGVWL